MEIAINFFQVIHLQVQPSDALENFSQCTLMRCIPAEILRSEFNRIQNQISTSKVKKLNDEKVLSFIVFFLLRKLNETKNSELYNPVVNSRIQSTPTYTDTGPYVKFMNLL